MVERSWGGAAHGLPGVVVHTEFAVSVGLPRRSAGEPGKVAGACEARGAGPSAGPGRGWGRTRGLGLSLPLLLGQLLALMGGGDAFYLEVRELEEKCFIQEIPDGTVVIGNYKTELYDPAMEKYQPSPQWINLFVLVKDPENKNLLAHQYGPQGSFTFTSQSPGEHQICLHLESIRFSLFYDGKLWREERFRLTSESTNRRVLWWSVLQTLILVATGIWQMRHLKSFFKAKKLV
ncbi:transmembrane emp24 domain-containing protein 9-like isoform 2-T2 [Hipposideros larvatus]